MTTTTDEELVMEPRTLNAQDRCDRCGAQAHVVAAFTASELMFCAHHATKFAEAIEGRVVLDNRDQVPA